MNNFHLSRLIKSVSCGDIEGLEKIFYEMKDSIFSFVLIRTGSKQIAEDILQETMLQIFHSAKSFKHFNNPKAWILTIARNTMVSSLRKSNKEIGLDDEYQIESFDINLAGKINTIQILSLLSQKEREIVVLHAIAGLRHKEIAGILDMPIGTVCWKYSESIKKLRQQTYIEEGVGF